MGTGGFSPGIKRPGREADHSPPAGAEVKKMWTYTSTSPYSLDNFKFYHIIGHDHFLLNVSHSSIIPTLDAIIYNKAQSVAK
jgi:hypothetical protein